MPVPVHLPLFIIASVALLLIPGPAVLYIITRSVDQGRRAGLVSVGAIEAGNFLQIVAAALGLSALLLSSAAAFTIVKYLGGAYLVYLGFRKIFSSETPQSINCAHPRSLRQIFIQGFIVAALNPKTALFFTAFLPQFVDPAQGRAVCQMLVLGGIFITLAIVSDSSYAILTGTLGHWIKGSWLPRRSGRYLTGGIYIGLGLTAALTDTHKQ